MYEKNKPYEAINDERIIANIGKKIAISGQNLARADLITFSRLAQLIIDDCERCLKEKCGGAKNGKS